MKQLIYSGFYCCFFLKLVNPLSHKDAVNAFANRADLDPAALVRAA